MNAPASTAANSQTIPLSQIDRDPSNPRKHFDEDALADLAASITEHGVIQPIVVRPVPPDADPRLVDTASYWIVAGERRWRASIKAGRDHIPAIVREDLTGDQVAMLQVIENLQRADLSLHETAAGVAHLVKRIGNTEAAKQLGKSPAWISKHANVATLDPRVVALVEGGQLSSADMAHDLDPLIDRCQEGVDAGVSFLEARATSVLDLATRGELRRSQLRDHLQRTHDDIAYHQRKGLIRSNTPQTEAGASHEPAAPAPAAGTDALPLAAPANEQRQSEPSQRVGEDLAQSDSGAERRAAIDALAQHVAPFALDLSRRLWEASGSDWSEATALVDDETDSCALLDAIDGEPPAFVLPDLPKRTAEEPVPAPGERDSVPVLVGLYLSQDAAERLVGWIEAGGLDSKGPAAPPAKTFESGEEALDQFIAECLADAPGESVKGSAISGAYTRYCHAHGVEPITSWPLISQRLRAAGYEHKRKAAGKFYLNCALVSA